MNHPLLLLVVVLTSNQHLGLASISNEAPLPQNSNVFFTIAANTTDDNLFQRLNGSDLMPLFHTLDVVDELMAIPDEFSKIDGFILAMSEKLPSDHVGRMYKLTNSNHTEKEQRDALLYWSKVRNVNVTDAINIMKRSANQQGTEESDNVSKRLFKSSGRLSSWASKARNVFTKVGNKIKKGVIKAKSFLKKAFNKSAEVLKKAKNKVKKSIQRAKDVFSKSKGVKYVFFMKECTMALWDKVPEDIKNSITDKAMDLVLGNEGDVSKGMEENDFHPEELMKDDELYTKLEQDEKAGIVKEQTELQKELGKMSPVDLKALMMGTDGDQVVELMKDKKHHGCCLNVDGTPKDAEEIEPEDISKIEDEEEDYSGLFNVNPDDFEADSLKSDGPDDDEVFNSVEDGYENDEDAMAKETPYEESFLAKLVGKRGIEKRSCACTHRARQYREMASAIRKREMKVKGELPALTSAVPPKGTRELLKLGHINIKGKLCGKASDKDCMDVSSVRLGGLAGLLSLRVLCPECEINLVGAEEKAVNMFLRGWSFVLEGTDTLSMFIMETFETYDGHGEYFDANKNKMTLIKVTEDQWKWEYLLHL